jgi:hypothetical protein
MPRDLALRPGLRLSFLITGIIGFLLGDWPAIALHSSGLLPAQVLLPSQIVALRFPDLSPSQIVALRFPDLSPSQIRPRRRLRRREAAQPLVEYLQRDRQFDLNQKRNAHLS